VPSRSCATGHGKATDRQYGCVAAGTICLTRSGSGCGEAAAADTYSRRVLSDGHVLWDCTCGVANTIPKRTSGWLETLKLYNENPKNALKKIAV